MWCFAGGAQSQHHGTTRHEKYRAWKGFDWEVLDRLHKKGLIDDPVGKAKSISMTEDGLKASELAFEKLFARPSTQD